ELSPAIAKLPVHLVIDRMHLFQRKQSTADTGLIGDHDASKSRPAQTLHRPGRPGKKTDLLRMSDIIPFFDERAVAVEEYGRLLCREGHSTHPSRARYTPASSAPCRRGSGTRVRGCLPRSPCYAGERGPCALPCPGLRASW